jgi:RimJ/RimL family protein N-acetyltransferase
VTKRLVFNDPRVVDFVRTQCGVGHWDSPASIGIEEGGAIIGGFVAVDCYDGIDIMCNIAGQPGRYWATRRFFQTVFRYLFGQLGLRRATALVDEANAASCSLVQRLGFKPEGVLRKRGAAGCDVIVWGMLREECSWL